MSSCEWFVEPLKTQSTWYEVIIFSVEAVFYLCGGVNHKNQVYWARNNSRAVLDIHPRFNLKVLVWFGMHGTTLIRPYYSGTERFNLIADIISFV